MEKKGEVEKKRKNKKGENRQSRKEKKKQKVRKQRKQKRKEKRGENRGNKKEKGVNTKQKYGRIGKKYVVTEIYSIIQERETRVNTAEPWFI